MPSFHHSFKWISLFLVLSLASCTTNKSIVEPQVLKPSLKQPANQTNTVGDQVQLKIEASNPDSSALSYQSQWLPQGLSIDGSSGLISGTVKKVETTTVTISVVNNQNQSSSVTFDWEVKAKPSEPEPTPIPSFILSINKAGTGSGTIVSDPSGINCGNTCSLDFDRATKISLTATPDEGSVFTGWSDACTGTESCNLTLDQDSAVTAIFDTLADPSPTFTLTVSKSGTGSGSIISTPAGITCGSTCTHDFDENTLVSLSAAPTTGSSFVGWSGACTGSSNCTVTMTQARNISAAFDLISTPTPTFTLTVNKSGTGSGTVVSTPAGINCGSTCAHNFDENSPVNLVANVATGSVFSGWGGACSGTTSCTVTMSQARTVSAIFDTLADPSPTFTLTVSKSGTGSGSIISTPAGITCGSTCTHDFDENTLVSLSAAPTTGSSFVGWSGACTGSSNCTVTMTQARNISATFDTLAEPVDPSLLAYWKFDNNGLDETTHNNNASLSNAGYTSGKFGQSLDLAGRAAQSYAKVSSSSSLNNVTDKLTVSAWVYPYVAPDKYHVVVSRQRADLGHPDQFFLGFGPKTPSRGGNGEITYKWHLSTTTNSEGADCYENAPLVSQWIHMVGTYDGSNIRLYVNGELICTRPISGEIPVDSNPITFGMEENDASRRMLSFFNGRIDEVKMFNRSLSASEIQSLYELGN